MCAAGTEEGYGRRSYGPSHGKLAGWGRGVQYLDQASARPEMSEGMLIK